MLSSLYAYKGTHARTLGFSAGERFLEVGISRDVNWVHVISEKGVLGYVPKNYVALEQAPPLQMLEIIDACIEAIHISASQRGGNYSRGEHEALQRLVEMRQEWHSKVPPLSHPNKRPAPPPPNRSSSHLSNETLVNGEIVLPQPPPPAIPPSSSSISLSQPIGEDSRTEISTSFIGRGSSLATGEEDQPNIVPPVRIESLGKCRDGMHNNNSNPSSLECIRNAIQLLPKEYLRKLVENIRSDTNISYSTSRQVVNTLFQSLGTTFPFMHPLLEAILDQADKTIEPTQSNEHNSTFMDSTDGKNLVDILEELRQCKDDEQQRSWALYEDEGIIKDHLAKLLEILNNGDLKVCKQILKLDDYRALLTLVQYYQMETRWILRKILLEVFGVVCQMSKSNITHLSSSVLPLELTRQIIDPETSTEQLKYCSMVLGIILSMGDTLPFTHFSIMDESFIEVLLNGIELYNQDPETESLAELYLTLVLAFNLQFHVTSFEDGRLNLPNQKSQLENVLVKRLAKRKENKYFLEKLLLLFNREEDPVAMFDFEPRPPHSVVCLMKDIYRCPLTAQILYTNDEMVVCDIILRQLTDLSMDDKRRTDYLTVLEGLVSQGHWKEHKHRRKEFSCHLSEITSQLDSPTNAALAKRICSFFLEFDSQT